MTSCVCGQTLTLTETHHRDTGSIYCHPDKTGVYEVVTPDRTTGGLDWWAIPDDHPGWDRLIDGIRNISRIHHPDHDCATCRKLAA